MQGVHVLSLRVTNSAPGTWKRHLGSERRQKLGDVGKSRNEIFVNYDKSVGRPSYIINDRRNAKSLRPMQYRARSTKVDTVGTTSGSAAVSINTGLQRYKEGKVDEALRLFTEALEMPLTQEEAQAALYNKACCHASRGQGKEAKEALSEALKKHDLRFSVILSDPDLASFRALPEFSQLQEQARKGSSEVGSSFRRDLKLMSEVQSPFRGVRKFLYFGFALAAGIATLFTVPRLIAALQGGENAPDLMDTAGNLGINVVGGAVLVWLYNWDQQKEEEQLIRLSRDENLSRLPLRIGGDKVVELNQLRESTRPVILAGKRISIEKALQGAEKYREKLLERGVVVVPIMWDHSPSKNVPPPAKPKGFGSAKKLVDGHKEEEGGIRTLEEIEQRAIETSAKRLKMVERRFRAEVVSAGEWRQWVRDQQKVEGLGEEEEVYLVLRLDGRLRKSGRGMPDWDALVSELPVLDSLISKLER